VNLLIPLAAAAGLFLAMPWLAIAFNRYCDAINRMIAKRKTTTDGTVCRAYQPPTTAEMTGLCARCGMYDYKHKEQTRA
jgi:triphosphoribosyl-dephospho-CoA synthetase